MGIKHQNCGCFFIRRNQGGSSFHRLCRERVCICPRSTPDLSGWRDLSGEQKFWYKFDSQKQHRPQIWKFCHHLISPQIWAMFFVHFKTIIAASMVKEIGDMVYNVNRTKTPPIQLIQPNHRLHPHCKCCSHYLLKLDSSANLLEL